MIYFEIFIAGMAVIATTYFFIYNFITRYKFRLNRIYAIVSLLGATLFSTVILLVLNLDFMPKIILGKVYLTVMLLIATFIIMFVNIFPDVKEAKIKFTTILQCVPGFIVAGLTIGTDYIVKDVTYEVSYIIQKSNGYQIYVIVTFLYFLGSVLVLFIKSRSFKNKVLIKEVTYLLLGIFMSVFIGLVCIIILPQFFEIYFFKNVGVILAGCFMLICINYAVDDIRFTDFKKFYIGTIFWLTLFMFLFVPVFLVFVGVDKFFDNSSSLPISGMSIIIFLYLFLFFKYLKPRIESFFERDYIKLVNDFNDFFNTISMKLTESDQDSFLENFYRESITGLIQRYGISSACLYLPDNISKKFKPIFKIGDVTEIEVIDSQSPVVHSIMIDSTVLPRSILHTDFRYAEYKEFVLDFFNEYNFDIAIPALNLEKKLVGILMLGNFSSGSLYSKTFLSALGLFRIQFQHQLSNGLILKDVKAMQIVEHDKMVVDIIKNKIIPKTLGQIKGIRVSSFYINNSKHGGDYFDAVKIENDKLVLFIADTMYSGVESALLSLELFTVLHTPVKNFTSPEKILNIMNWVISTSRLSEKYAPAFCMIYNASGEIVFSNAAFNPPVIYNTKTDNFSILDIKGVPIGVDREFVYESESVKLPRGSIGLFHSDGLSSAINEKGENYTLDRIKKIIKREKEESPAIITREIYSDLKEFIKDKKQINDISVIVFKL